MTKRAVRVVVTGRVQGVGFRAFTVRRAAALGLDGFVRNRADGAVETEAAGSEPAIEAFLDALRQGPPASRVDDLAITDLPPETIAVDGFTVR